MIRYREVVKELEKLNREVGKRFDKDDMLKKDQLEINFFLYCLSRGSRAIYCSEKIPRSRIRGVESNSQVIEKGTILSFYSYYLWKYWKFSFFFSLLLYYCFVILIKYSRTQKRHHNIILLLSLSVALELNGYLSDWGFFCFLFM